MKNFIRIIMTGLGLLLLVSTAVAQNKDSELSTVYIKSNMDCMDCELTLTNYLKFEKGLKSLKVDLVSNTIKVVYKSEKNTPESIAKGIKKNGYEATLISEEEYNKLFGNAPKKKN